MSLGEKPPRYMNDEELREWQVKALAGELREGYAFVILRESEERFGE